MRKRFYFLITFILFIFLSFKPNYIITIDSWILYEFKDILTEKCYISLLNFDVIESDYKYYSYVYAPHIEIRFENDKNLPIIFISYGDYYYLSKFIEGYWLVKFDKGDIEKYLCYISSTENGYIYSHIDFEKEDVFLFLKKICESNKMIIRLNPKDNKNHKFQYTLVFNIEGLKNIIVYIYENYSRESLDSYNIIEKLYKMIIDSD